jgi:hypothetical protein
MTSVGIAEPEAALQKVRQFISLLENSRAIYRNNARGSEQGRLANGVHGHEKVPVCGQV